MMICTTALLYSCTGFKLDIMFGRKEKHAAIEGRRVSKESEALAMSTLKAACLREWPPTQPAMPAEL